MHGLKSEDLRHLLPLRKAELTYVGVGEFQIDFVFSPENCLSIEGRCELKDEVGKLVDMWEGGKRSDHFRFFDLLGRTIAEIAIDSDKSFVATFDTGWQLRVVDNSDQYESFSVNGLYV